MTSCAPVRETRFVDTDVLVHLRSSDPGRADRVEPAVAAAAVVSIRVLSEFTAVARRRLSVAWREIDEMLSVVRQACRVEALTIETCDRARAWAERYRWSWYDAMIAACALQAGCATLRSEDFRHGFVIGRKPKVVDPFA